MTFPYWDIVNENEEERLPILPIRLYGPKKSVEIRAIVDSGAEHNAFGIDVAQEIGLDLERAEPFSIVGFGHEPVTGYREIIELQLRRFRWPAPAVFVDAPNQFNVVGQAGFFAFFNVDFRYQEKEMRIRRVK